MAEASFSFDELQSANTVELPDPETLTARDIDQRFPLSQVPDAIRYLEAGSAKGKVVITVAGNGAA